MKIYYDIGANVGEYASAMLAKHGDAKVICVEANPGIIPKLRKRLAPWPGRFEIVNRAATDLCGPVTLHICSKYDGISTCSPEWITQTRFNRDINPTGPFAVAKQDWHEIKVPAITLDELIAKYGKPYVIKMDVEGHELHVIGSLTLRQTDPPYGVLFEWMEENLAETFRVMSYLETLGFAKFGAQHNDNTIEAINYFDKETCMAWLESMREPGRFFYWGMVHCL